MLHHAEFAYNRVPHKTTGSIPFEVVYGCNPCTPLDLASFATVTKFSKEAEERAMDIKKLHEQVREKIIKINEKVKFRLDKKKTSIPARRFSLDSPQEGAFSIQKTF